MAAPCVHHLVEARARTLPNAQAITFGQVAMTYGELNARANQLARLLMSNGVRPESRVGVCLPRSPELLIAFLAVMKAGGAYVPLDPNSGPDHRLNYVLAETAASLVITTLALSCHFDLNPIHALHMDTHAPELAAEPVDNVNVSVLPDNLAYVIYTSGSTGTPKGVSISHRGLANYLHWCVDAYSRPGRAGAPLFSSYAFDMVVPVIYVPLIVGQSVCVVPESVSFGELGEFLVSHGPFAFVKLTPGQLDLLMEQCSPAEARSLTKLFVVGGEFFPVRMVQRWRELAPHVELVNEYGPTEASVANCAYLVENGLADRVPIGRPIPRTTQFVLDDNLQPLHFDEVGEIYVGGDGLARGYVARPALTGERFIPDPFSTVPGGRLYRTGDLGRQLPNGTFEFIGRVDDQVKIRGHRVEPAEIEMALVAYPGVRHAAVIPVERPAQHRQLVAYLVMAEGISLATPDIRRHLRQQIPEYMVPSKFVALPTLPLDENGKIDRRRLPTSPARSERRRD